MNVSASTMAGAQVALSILTRGGDGGSAKVVAPAAATVAKAESPAVIIDPQIEALVGKQAEAAGRESGGEGDSVAARMQRFEWLRGMVEGAEKSVREYKKLDETGRKIVKLYETTGKLYQPNSQGEYQEYVPEDGWKEGDLEAIISVTKNAVKNYEMHKDEIFESAKNMRKNYEISVYGINQSV